MGYKVNREFICFSPTANPCLILIINKDHMDTEPIQPVPEKKKFGLLLWVVIPLLFCIILLGFDRRAGMGVTGVFLLVNLICSIMAGFGMVDERVKKGMPIGFRPFFIPIALFVLNWMIAIFVSLIAHPIVG